VAAEAKRLGVPLLGELPLALEVRLAGDAGRPVAADEGPAAEAYARIARTLIAQGVA
jgi:ATP-binding protein involved in chromosome partitioning